MKWFDNTALTIVIIGAVNWLLVGIFRFDLVAFLFGNLSWLSRIIYTIVGILDEQQPHPNDRGLFGLRPSADSGRADPAVHRRSAAPHLHEEPEVIFS